MKILLPIIEKAWVKHHERRNKKGESYPVSGYWRNDKQQGTSKNTWKDYGLPKWGDIMKKKTSRLIEPIETIEELETYLQGLKEVFRSDKEGWAMLPSSYGEMYISIEPKYYGHWLKEKGRIEADNRIRYFRAVVETLIQPWEIWKQPVGKGNEDGRVFIAGYHVLGERDKGVVVMVGFRKNKPILWTAIPMSEFRGVDKKRYGELLFKNYD